MSQPVLDRTGFTGEFDLDLRFAADQSTTGLPDPGPGAPADPSLPNIFATLRKQLGLKLVPAKGPVEVLVAGHAEEATVNQVTVRARADR